MPYCCAGIHCKHPELGLHGGHGGIKNCPDCGEKIHDPCAIIDEDAGLSKMNVCPECFYARKPPAEDDVPTGGSARSNKKKRNDFVCEQFLVLEGTFSEGGRFRCKHCMEQTFVWNTWNSSKARSHLERCCDTPEEVRVAVAESSQASRKKLKTELLISTYATSEREPAEEPEAKSCVLRKKRTSFVCDQFVVLQGAFSEGGSFRCKHCDDQTFVWSKWNSSKARSHLERCCDTPEEVRIAVAESSQASRKKLKMSATVSMTLEEEKAVVLGLEEKIRNMKAKSKQEAKEAQEKSRQDIEDIVADYDKKIEDIVTDYEKKISDLDLGKKEVELELAIKSHELAKMNKELLAAKHAQLGKSATKRGDKANKNS
jgi:hypothetical protein